MLRDAANDSGERFLESVDTDVVGDGYSPQWEAR